MLISDAVHIWRDADGDYHLEWEATHPQTEVTVEPLGEGVVTHRDGMDGATPDMNWPSP